MNKKLCAGLSAFFLLLFLSRADAADNVRTGFGTLAGTHMVLYVAKEFGLYSTLGSSSDFSLRFGLRKLGVDPEKDVTILAMGDSPIRAAALNSGMIHGSAFNLGEVTVARRFGHRVALDLAAAGMEYQATAAATTQSFLKKNRKAVVNYSKAIIDAMSQMKRRKEETLKIMAKYLRTNDREAVEAQYEENVNKLFAQKPYPTVNGVKTILQTLADKDERARAVKPEQFVDLSIVRELDESKFIDGLYK